MLSTMVIFNIILNAGILEPNINDRQERNSYGRLKMPKMGAQKKAKEAATVEVRYVVLYENY